MTAVVKKKIVEKLARFTKDLKPSDISLSFLTGKAVLQKIELNADFLTEIFHLPPCLQIRRVVCDLIKADVPFTSLGTNPIQIMINRVEVEVVSCDGTTPRAKQFNDLKLGNNNGPSSYGYVDKVVDGMKVSIQSVVLTLKDPTFEASLEVTNVVIQSTTPQWKPGAHLKDTRFKNEEEDYVIIYKMCSWDSVKVEGVSMPNVGQDKLRLLSEETAIRLALKRKLSDCSIVHSRVSIHLGDIMCVLTQTQLRASSVLVQRLVEAAVSLEDAEGEHQEKKAAPPGHSTKDPPKTQKQATPHHAHPVTAVPIQAYQDGKTNLSPYLVIQNSFHLRCGKIDVHLDDDLMVQAHQQGGRMNILFERVMLDVYPDQVARSGRHHWNKANDLIKSNVKWSAEMLGVASRSRDTAERDVFVSVNDLREMGVVFRCAEFAVNAVRKKVLPLITSDKATFKIPDDDDNPAIQVGLTLYSYPKEKAGKFLVPRPNMYVYMSPIHINFHQESCLWLAEFIHGVIATVNVDLAKTAVEEGNAFLKSHTSASAVSEQKQVGVDLKFRLLFSKITMPIPEVKADGRPKALQIETSSIDISNCALGKMAKEPVFCSAMEWLRKGWVFKTHFSKEFPHFAGDFEPFSASLSSLLSHHFPDKSQPPTSLSDNPSLRKLDSMSVEVWQLETACVSVSFPDSYSHDATLRPKQFVRDFPLRLWLFPPPLRALASEAPACPKVSFILHLPQPLHVTLERLQLLFLLDVKDSFRNFQFTITQLLLGNRSPPSPPEPVTTSEGPDNGSQSVRDAVSMGGCVIINTVNVEVLLPTLFNRGSSPEEAEQQASVAAKTEMYMELESKEKDAPLHRLGSMSSLLTSDKFMDSSSSSPFPDDQLPDVPRAGTNLHRSSSSSSIMLQSGPSPSGSTANLSAQREGEDDDDGGYMGDLQSVCEDAASLAEAMHCPSDVTHPPSASEQASSRRASSPASAASPPHTSVAPLHQASTAPPQASTAPPPRVSVAPPPQASAAPPPQASAVPPPQAALAPPHQASAAPPPQASAVPPPQAALAPPHQASTAPPPRVSVASPPHTSVAPPPQASTAQPPQASAAPPPQTSVAPPSIQPTSSPAQLSSLPPPGSTNAKPFLPPTDSSEDGFVIVDDPLSSDHFQHPTPQRSSGNIPPHPQGAPVYKTLHVTPTVPSSLRPAPSVATPPGPVSSVATPPGPASSVATPPGPASLVATPPGPASLVATPPGPASLVATPPGPASSVATPPGPASSVATPPGPASSVATPPGPASSVATPPGPAPSVATPPGPAPSVATPPGPASSVATPPGPASSVAAPPGPASTVATPPGPASSVATPPGPASSVATPPGPASSVATPPGPASSVATPPGPASSVATPPGPLTIPPSMVTPVPSRDVSDNISLSTEASSTNNLRARVPKQPIHGKTQGYVAPPPYVLLIHVENACVLPNITPKGISVRGSVDYVQLEEVRAEHRPRHTFPVPNDSPEEYVPVVKLRFELGERVGNLFPGTLPPPKTAAMIKVDGLDASFWVPNLTYLKDFFEDEYVTDEPLPVHIRVDNTSMVMRDAAGHTADDPHSLRIQVHGVCVHRGPRLEGVNVFAEDSAPVLEREGVADVNGSEGNGILKDMFRSFISVFDAHIQKFGEVKLPYGNHIAGLLYQLKSSLSSEPSDDQTDTVSVIHPRWYKMSSVQTELQRLRKENENLSKYEEENHRLTKQLVDVMTELKKLKSENDGFIAEIKAKQDIVLTYKQLIEKQHTQIENLVSDRDNLVADLDVQTESSPR